MEPLIFAIIVNYNNYDDLKEVIDSFRAQDCQNLKIVIVDNGSDETYRNKIKALNNIVLLQIDENQGWAKANNMGIKYAMSKNADYVVLANNDVFFDDSSLIVRLLDGFGQLGGKTKIIGPTNKSYFDKSKTINEGVFLFGNKKSKLNKYRLVFEKANTLHKPFRSVDSVHGCFMVVKPDIFEEIGLFDERYFFYYDEIDFSIRAWKNGFVSVVDQSLTVYHKVSSTAVEKSPFYLYYLTRNRILFLKKHKDIAKLRYYLVNLSNHFVNIANILFRKKKRRFKGNRLSLIGAVMKGLMHGFYCKGGKGY